MFLIFVYNRNVLLYKIGRLIYKLCVVISLKYRLKFCYFYVFIIFVGVWEIGNKEVLDDFGGFV